MSPPAQNARSPSPLIRTACTSGSVCQRAKPPCSARHMSNDSAFRARGRFKVTITTPPRCSMRMSSLARMVSAVEQATGDDQPHDLVGAFEDLVHPDISEEALYCVFLYVAVAAVQLQGVVAHVEGDVGGKSLGHGASDGGIRRVAVERRRRPVHH